MTRPDVDPELRSFMETYERLLVLTDTASVTPSLQPQFVARLLRGRPGELIAIQELYDRIREGGEPVEALRQEVARHDEPLASLLRSAEALEAPEPDQPAAPAIPIAVTPAPDGGPAAPPPPPDTDVPADYAAFVADHGRLTGIARRVGRGSVDRGLRGIGARPVDIVALRQLADRVLDPTVRPEDVVGEIRDRRALLDELLVRAGEARPSAETALVARVRSATAGGADGSVPAPASPLAPTPADQAACDDYLHLYERLVAAGGATRLPDPAAGHEADLAAAAELAERIRGRQAPTRVLAIEVERTRPTIEALLAELAEPPERAERAEFAELAERGEPVEQVGPTDQAELAELAEPAGHAEPALAGSGPRRFVPGGSADAGTTATADPTTPAAPKRFTPLALAGRRVPTPQAGPEAVTVDKPALAGPEIGPDADTVENPAVAAPPATPGAAVDPPSPPGPDVPPAPVVAPLSLPPPPRRRVFDVRRLLILVIVLAVLDLAALSWWYFTRDDPSTAESVAAVAPTATTDGESAPSTTVNVTVAPAAAPATTASPPTTAASRPATTAPPTTAPTTTAPPAPPTSVLPEVASGDQCHLVPIISYPSLDGAVRFLEQGDGVRTELPPNLRAYPSAEVPGYGQVGYLVAAVGATPEEAEELVLEAAESGFTTRAITLPHPCPVATLAR